MQVVQKEYQSYWITTRRLGVGVWGMYRFWASRIDTGKKNRDDQKPLGRKDNRPPIDSFATDKEVQALEVSGPHKGAAMLPEGSKPCHAPNVPLPSLTVEEVLPHGDCQVGSSGGPRLLQVNPQLTYIAIYTIFGIVYTVSPPLRPPAYPLHTSGGFI